MLTTHLKTRKLKQTCTQVGTSHFTSCWKVVGTSSKQAANNSQQGWWTLYKVVPTKRIQSWYNNIVTSLLSQLYYNLVRSGMYQNGWDNLVLSSCYSRKSRYKLSTNCSNLVGKLATICEVFTCLDIKVVAIFIITTAPRLVETTSQKV